MRLSYDARRSLVRAISLELGLMGECPSPNETDAIASKLVATWEAEQVNELQGFPDLTSDSH